MAPNNVSGMTYRADQNILCICAVLHPFRRTSEGKAHKVSFGLSAITEIVTDIAVFTNYGINLPIPKAVRMVFSTKAE